MLHNVTTRRQFTRQYNLNRKALEADPLAANLPNVSIIYEDKHGISSLQMETMRLDSDWQVPAFDLTYAHANKRGELPPQQSLLEGLGEMAARMAFRSKGFGVSADRQDWYVSVNAAALRYRRGLLPLAHELGHVATLVLPGKAVELAIGLSSDDAGLEPYQPCLDTLAKYAQANPNFRDDYAAVKAEWSASGVAASPLLHIRQGERWPYLDGRHEEAYITWNVLAEASAWRSAFEMIEAGRLHPGLSQHAMIRVAQYAMSTYDADYETTAYGQALQYSLAHT